MGRVRLIGMMAAISVLIIISLDIPKFIFLMSILYLASGFFLWFTKLSRKRFSRKESAASTERIDDRI